MIDQFEASKEDFDLFQSTEKAFFNLFKKWNNIYFGTSQQILDFIIGDDVEIEVNYQKPVMEMTEAEKIDGVIKKREAGLMSRVEAIAELRGISHEAAEYVAEEIDRYDGLAVEAPMTEEKPIIETKQESKDDSEDQNTIEE